MAALRNRVVAALPGLPKDVDPWFASLTPEVVGYSEAKRILSILTAARPEARTLFGGHSGTAGDWDAIIRAYEKDLLYLGEGLQIMVQNVNYEVPYLKKQITKLQQQLADLDQKETEYKRNAAAAALKYQQACQELGVNGNNIRTELLATAKRLPLLFTEIQEMLCSESIGRAVNCYDAYVTYAHGKEGVESDTVVPTLKMLRDSPEKDVADMSFYNLNMIPKEGTSDCPNLQVGTEENETADIDWDIEIESYVGPQLAKNVEEQHSEIKQSSRENPVIDLADPILDASFHAEPTTVRNELPSADSFQGDIVWDTEDIRDTGEQLEIQWDIDKIEQCETEISGIQWDISIEDEREVGSIHQPLYPLGNATYDREVEQEQVVASRFMETDYRNSLLNDLLEIRAFLTQRIEESNREETSSLQNQVQAISPQDLQQYGNDLFNAMTAEISKAILLLTNKNFRDLIMIITSQRFLNGLEASLEQKKNQELKLMENLKDIEHKRLDLRNMLAALWPKQEAALKRTRETKDLCEKAISNLYEGRPINIIGEINSILGQA